MSDQEANDRLLFEKSRREVIERLQALSYDDDAHFIVITGNHSDAKTEMFSCDSWVIRRLAELTEHMAEKNGVNVSSFEKDYPDFTSNAEL